MDKAIRKAVEAKPKAIVLIAVKAYLDEEFVKSVTRAVGNSGAKVFTFSLWQEHLEKELKKVANQTGGKYRNVTPNELRDAAGR